MTLEKQKYTERGIERCQAVVFDGWHRYQCRNKAKTKTVKGLTLSSGVRLVPGLPVCGVHSDERKLADEAERLEMERRWQEFDASLNRRKRLKEARERLIKVAREVAREMAGDLRDAVAEYDEAEAAINATRKVKS